MAFCAAVPEVRSQHANFRSLSIARGADSGPSRHPLVFGRLPGVAGYTAYLAPAISRRENIWATESHSVTNRRPICAETIPVLSEPAMNDYEIAQRTTQTINRPRCDDIDCRHRRGRTPAHLVGVPSRTIDY